MIQFRKRKMNILFLLIPLLIVLLNSCNLFMANPLLRENPNDDRRQITGFTAGPTGATSITTVWNWKPPQDWFNYGERIDEIKIIHSTLGYQNFNIPFVGQPFTDKSLWQYEWKDLKADTTHYFSLFAKTEDGRWIPSYKIKVSLPGKTTANYFNLQRSMEVRESMAPNILDTTSGITIENDGGGNDSILVVEFDVPGNIYITCATIKNGTTEGLETANTLLVYPVKFPWNEDINVSDGYYQLTDSMGDNYVVDDTISTPISDTPDSVNDVTAVIQKAILYGTNQIVFKYDGIGSTGATVNVHSPSFVDITYVSE